MTLGRLAFTFVTTRDHSNFVRLSSVVLTIIALSFSSLFPAAMAEMKQAPGSHIALDLGPGFTQAERFNGFVDNKTGATFITIDLPRAAYDEMKTLPQNKQELEAHGLSGLTESTLEGRTQPYIYLSGTQESEAGPLAKFLLIFRQRRRTGMIIGNIPQAALDSGIYSKAQIEQILTSARIAEQPGKAAELYRFGYLGPLQPAFTLDSRSRAYSASGRLPGPGDNPVTEEPLLVVSHELDGRAIEIESAAKRSFSTLSGLESHEVEKQGPVEIGGLKGYQVLGEAKEADTGKTVGINLVLLSGESGGYYALVGTVPEPDRAKMMSEMQKVIASFEAVKGQ